MKNKSVPKSRRIDASKWTQPYTERGDHYRTEGQGYEQFTYDHGRAKAYTDCGFCEAESIVYIHSFAGGGKKCHNCGAIMFPGGAIAEKDRVVNLPTDEA